MKVNTNLGAGGVGGPIPPKRTTTAAKTSSEAAAFSSSSALEQALKNTPDSRPEAVERAKGLINDVNYPPLETIRKISKLLAIQTQSDQE